MGKTNKCNLREYETLIEVIKNANVCMIKSSRFTPFSSLSLNIARTYDFLGFLLNLLFLTLRSRIIPVTANFKSSVSIS